MFHNNNGKISETEECKKEDKMQTLYKGNSFLCRH